MAVTFTLGDGTTTIDLTDTTTSIFLQESAYVPVVATPTGDGSSPPYVIETMPVGIHATTYDAYATVMQSLHTLQKRAAEYWVDQQQTTPVWLTCKLDGETNSRRALVKAIHFEFRNEGWQEWLYQECGTGVPPTKLWGTLLVERHPYWERPTGRAFPNTTPTAAAAVAYDYTTTADVVGDVGARINALAFRGSAALNYFWMGLRSANKHGTPANFVPVWELEDGTMGADSTADAATEPNTASPGGGSGSRVVVAENVLEWDNTWANVCHITLNDVGYDTAAKIPCSFGRFLVLCRAKIGAGTWEMRLMTGYPITGYSYTDPVEVDDTDWVYYEMGIVNVPPRNLQAIEDAYFSTDNEEDFTVYLNAQRTSGAGNLFVDCLCWVPLDEGFFCTKDGLSSATQDTILGEGPKEDTAVVVYSSVTAGTFDICTFEFENFRLPIGDGRLICVYSTAGADVFATTIEFADAAEVASYYTERWISLRGSE